MFERSTEEIMEMIKEYEKSKSEATHKQERRENGRCIIYC